VQCGRGGFGHFSPDRMDHGGRSFRCIEGMIMRRSRSGSGPRIASICAWNIPHAARALALALKLARERGYLGRDICGAAAPLRYRSTPGSGRVHLR
jgi:NADH:ubiquinone oxidoreductase subunit F (NADH-binding)